MVSGFDLVYRCYILPLMGAILFIVLTLPTVNDIFLDWIPNVFYSNLIKVLFVVLFITCRILDILNLDDCHPGCSGCSTGCSGNTANNNPNTIDTKEIYPDYLNDINICKCDNVNALYCPRHIKNIKHDKIT